MGDVSTNVISVRLHLADVWGGDDVVREMTLAELETSERGIAVGPAFYPWRRVVSYEWEVLESEPDPGLARPRQLLVRVLTQGPDGPEEHRVAADRFEVGPWTVSMVIPDRVDTETQRSVMRRITFPWHRVLEYERMLVEATTGALVPDRPDLAETPQLDEASPDGDENGHVVIDVAAVERETNEDAPAVERKTSEDDADATEDPIEEPSTEVDAPSDDDAREPVAVGTGARVKKAVPRKTGHRRKRPRPAS
jgi:hypothetical protein